MITRLRLTLLIALCALMPSAAAAQGTPAGAAGPRLDATSVAFRSPAESQPAEMQARTRSMGRPVALMVVGGAALVLGVVIGDDVGALFSIAGAVAFLYGLYLYLR